MTQHAAAGDAAENSRQRPEFFLCDQCLPDEFKPASCDLCGDQGPLLLHAKCHLTAPLKVTLDGDTLIVACYLPECGREVARFKVVR